jgi:hypothetical protein
VGHDCHERAAEQSDYRLASLTSSTPPLSPVSHRPDHWHCAQATTMTDSDSEQKTARLEPELRDMKIEEGVRADVEDEGAVRVKVEDYDEPERTLTPLPTALKVKSRSATQSPTKLSRSTSSTPVDGESEEVVGGDITLKMEPGKAPKLARTASKKVISRAAPLYLDLPDASEESKTTFGVLPECTYGNKYLGTTEHAFECDCSEEWGKSFRFSSAE